MKTVIRFLPVIGILFFSSLSGLLVAQNNTINSDDDTIRQQNLSEVVITANRYSSDRFNTPEAIELLRSKTIEQNQLRSTPEALSITPGVFVQKTNHGGGSPFIRGLTGNQNLQMIDGIRLNNATFRYGPNQYFNTIDVFSLDKIEVLRGNGSVQYGSDALGGTIQAFSRDASFSEKPKWGSSLLTRFATQGMEQTLHADLDFGSEKVAFRGGLSWRNFGDVVGGDTTGIQAPNGYKELDYDMKGKIRLSLASVVTMAYQNVHQQDVNVYHKVELENYAVNKMDPQNRRLAYIRLNQVLNYRIFKSATITASLQNTEEGRESRKNGSNTLRDENDKVRSLAFTAETVTSKGEAWSASSGIEIYNDLVNSRRTDTDLSTATAVSKRGLYPDGSTMSSFAAFTLHSFDLPKWIISAGARFNTFVIQVDDEAVGATKLTPSALVGSASIMRKLSATSNVFISANTGFRAPNIDDLGTLGIVDFRYEIPNFDLKPEKSFQYQLGYKLQGNKLRGEIFLYRNELYNLIVRNRVEGDTIEGYPVYKKENVERAFIQGVEASADYDLTTALSFSGGITYTYGQNITLNEPVRRIPPLFGRLAAEYKYKNWWYNLEWLAAAKQDRLAQGDKDDNRIPEGGTPGWNIFNINTGYTWRFLSLDLRLQNLLNKDYRYHGSGVNGYGRSALMTVKVKI
ncbi:MAG: TonB-dependent receptor [Lentimicrobiaceae bacterium]|jgi:outer membrane receptor protein involved in Fe transport